MFIIKRVKQSEEILQKKKEFDGYLVFGTRSFNKRTKRNKHIDSDKKLAWDFFIDKKTGLLKEEMAKNRNCPICGKRNFETLFNKDGFIHVKCKCGFIFVNPTASDKYRDVFFRDIYKSWIEVLLTNDEVLIDSKKFKYGLEFIENNIDSKKNKGFIVDIGAGSGLFLKTARDKGWKVSAVEFNQKSIENIKKLGIEVFNKPLEEGIYLPDSVDVVTIWEVLEHVNYPNEFIKEIRNILKPGGYLFVCVPNINALVTRILHEKSGTFGGFTHVNFFSIDTLSKLLQNHKFDVLISDNAISELGSIKNYLSYEDPYTSDSSFNLDFLTPRYLYEHDLGSRIFMLGRKKE
jgi:SAM-dependent methyltransferase